MPNILVVRKFDDFSRILSESGFTVVNCPAIKTVALEGLGDLAAKLKDIDKYDGVFLTSATATEILIEKLLDLKIRFNGKVYVLGKRSFDLLKTANLHAVYFSAANTAGEMLEKITPEDLKNKRFLFVRGEKSLRVVPNFLNGVAEIDEAAVYRTENAVVASDKIKQLAEMSAKREIACAVFFSPSGAESFLKQCGTQFLHQISIATIGKTTADFLEKRNLRVAFAARKASAKDFAIELIDFLRNQPQSKQINEDRAE